MNNGWVLGIYKGYLMSKLTRRTTLLAFHDTLLVGSDRIHSIHTQRYTYKNIRYIYIHT